MVFSSLTFIFFFLPLALAAYYSFPRSYRNAVLLFFSLLFYASGEVKYLWLIGLSILFNYTAALLLEKYRDHRCDEPAKHRKHKEQPKLVALAARSARGYPGGRNCEGNQDEQHVAGEAEGIHVDVVHV